MWRCDTMERCNYHCVLPLIVALMDVALQYHGADDARIL